MEGHSLHTEKSVSYKKQSIILFSILNPIEFSNFDLSTSHINNMSGHRIITGNIGDITWLEMFQT